MTDMLPNTPLKILFVCSANLCRSPLAEIIAAKFHKEMIEAQSAGVSPAYCPIYMETVCVAEKFYGADFSGHRPRHVLECSPEEYDYIIAMDSSVREALAEMISVPQDKIVTWEIADPCGYDIEVYERAARDIEREMKRFIEDIKEEKQGNDGK